MDIIDAQVTEKEKTFAIKEVQGMYGKQQFTVWTYLLTFQTHRGQKLRMEVPEKTFNKADVDDKGELFIKRGRFKKFRIR